jgi:uncharacterized membrane protein HdeD (DUF308 family)
MLLLIAGIVELLFAFRAESFGKGVLRFLFGGLGVLAGIIIIATPTESLGILTFILAVFFVAGGVIDIFLALKLRPEEGWGWTLFSGIVSLTLGGLIIGQWPVSGIWAVGLYIGVRMLMHGWMLMALGRTGQEMLTYLQDTRIEKLERHVRAGARAIHEAQAQLADHAAMLLTLDNELRKKISTSEVDPAIRELNQKLGEAREQMQTLTSATRETWDKAQNEANAAFEKVQKSAAEITKRLKHELGLEEHSRLPEGRTD